MYLYLKILEYYKRRFHIAQTQTAVLKYFLSLFPSSNLNQFPRIIILNQMSTIFYFANPDCFCCFILSSCPYSIVHSGGDYCCCLIDRKHVCCLEDRSYDSLEREYLKHVFFLLKIKAVLQMEIEKK